MPVDETVLRQAFHDARTHNAWLPKEVPDSLLHSLVEMANLGPTSLNCEPARYLFVRSKEAKEKLAPLLTEGNRAKTMQAPVCAIVGYDMDFYEQLPRLFPHKDVRGSFTGKAQKIHDTAFRNGSLQGGYLIMAARLLGLDCGPMSGFDNVAVDAAFFAGTGIRSNFLCNLGYGDASALKPRLPRLPFADCAQII